MGYVKIFQVEMGFFTGTNILDEKIKVQKIKVQKIKGQKIKGEKSKMKKIPGKIG